MFDDNKMQIYLARNNVQAGPYTLDEFNRMLQSGEVVASDLMWHTPMSEWRTVGDAMQGVAIYDPKFLSSMAQQRTHTNAMGFGDNVDFHNAQKRISVDELYGRQSTQSKQSTTEQPFQTKTVIVEKSAKQAQYASVFARITAFAINLALYLLALLPILTAFGSVVDANELVKYSGDFGAMYAYSQKISQKIPQTSVVLSNIMLVVLFVVQLLLIVKRRQSFGKMLMGICILDEQTKQMSSIAKILLRTFLLVGIYGVACAYSVGIALCMLVINCIQIKINKNGQGWHDKLTKSCVGRLSALPIQSQKDN